MKRKQRIDIYVSDKTWAWYHSLPLMERSAIIDKLLSEQATGIDNRSELEKLTQSLSELDKRFQVVSKQLDVYGPLVCDFEYQHLPALRKQLDSQQTQIDAILEHLQLQFKSEGNQAE